MLRFIKWTVSATLTFVFLECHDVLEEQMRPQEIAGANAAGCFVNVEELLAPE